MNQTSKSVEAQLRFFFLRNGCLRAPDSKRRKRDKSRYKKGYEIRFTANDQSELMKIQSLLEAARFEFGKPYEKRTQFIQPVYGKSSFERFRNITHKKP